jgi:hypothetical protein
MPDILLISGGQGAGKSTLGYFESKGIGLSNGLVERFALADLVRGELMERAIQEWCARTFLGDAMLAPGMRKVPWYSTDQAEKSRPRPELGGRTIRDLLIYWGQHRCKDAPLYWAEKWCARAESHLLFHRGHRVVCDDLRKLTEHAAILAWAEQHAFSLLHLHIDGGIPDYDCLALRERAHFVLTRGGTPLPIIDR